MRVSNHPLINMSDILSFNTGPLPDLKEGQIFLFNVDWFDRDFFICQVQESINGEYFIFVDYPEFWSEYTLKALRIKGWVLLRDN